MAGVVCKSQTMDGKDTKGFSNATRTIMCEEFLDKYGANEEAFLKGLRLFNALLCDVPGLDVLVGFEPHTSWSGVGLTTGSLSHLIL